TERFTVATNGRAEDHEILHGAAKRDTDDDPESSREKTELRRQRWPDQRTGPRNRSEVVTENHPTICRREVAPVVEPHRWRRPSGVEREHVARDELAVEPVCDGVRTQRGDQQPRCIHSFTA